MLRKRRKSDAEKMESSLDARLREVAEREAKNRAEMEQCQQVIKDAPQRAKKKAEAQREQLIARAAHTEMRPGNRAALPDRWRPMEANVAAPARDKRLRAERRQGRLLFFVLLFTLLGAGYWLYYTITHS